MLLVKLNMLELNVFVLPVYALKDEVVTKASVFVVVALPVSTVIVKALLLPLLKVIILPAADAVTRAFEADACNATIDDVTLDVKFNILLVKVFILLV